MCILEYDFQARNEDAKHHHYDTFLRYVQKALDDIRWEIDRNEFDELMAIKNESPPVLDEIPESLYGCAGGLGSQFLFHAYIHVPEVVLSSLRYLLKPRLCWLQSPPTSTTMEGSWDHSEALRPRWGLHLDTMRCIRPSQRRISAKHMTDDIFEIETTALAHAGCVPRSFFFFKKKKLLPHVRVGIMQGSSMYWRKTEMPEFICHFWQIINYDSTTRVELARGPEDTSSWPWAWDKAVRQVGYCFRWPSTLSVVGSTTRSFQGTPAVRTFYF